MIEMRVTTVKDKDRKECNGDISEPVNEVELIEPKSERYFLV